MLDNVPVEEDLSEDQELSKFKLDISDDADIVEEQRDQANEDMRFVNVTGGQWEGFLTDDFDDNRVKLEFDTVSDFLSRFIGEWNLNRIGVDYKPDDSATSDDDAELINSVYRMDFSQFSGKEATDNAVDEAATCGYGAFKLATKFEDEEDEFNEEMRIEWRPLYNAYNTVFWDKSAQRIDKLDARRCTVLKEFSPEEFKSIYPDLDAVSAYTPVSRAFENRDVSSTDRIYIATRYEIKIKKEKVFIYNNLADEVAESYSEEDHKLVKNELAADERRIFVRERTKKIQRVWKSVFTGTDFIETPRRIVGKWIPVIPVYGYHGYVDGAEWYRGLVRNRKDPARLFNMQVSQIAEISAGAGSNQPIFDPDQMDGVDISEAWADPTNKAWLPARALRDDNNNIIHSGPIGYLQPPQLDGATQHLLQLVPNYLERQNGGAPQDTLDPDASGKAIKAMLKRENLNTQRISDNIANAIRGSGVVYQSMAAEVYNTQRILRTVGLDGTESETQLLKTVFDKETGRIVEANTLFGKKFRVYSDTSPQYETEREQVVEDAKGIIATLTESGQSPDMIEAFLSILIENMPTDGFKIAKDLNRRNMLAKGLVKPETEEEEAMLAQLQQQAQQPDPQQVLIEAAAQQQEAEARSLDASSVQKIADAEKKGAETVEILEGIDMKKLQQFLDQQNAIADRQVDVVGDFPIQ